MAKGKGYTQVNVNLTKDDVKLLDWMQKQDAIENRSAWVRRLIRLEWTRRFPNSGTSEKYSVFRGEKQINKEK